MSLIAENTHVTALLFALTGFGSLDINRAAQWLDEADADYGDFATFIESFCQDTGTSFVGLDIVAVVLEFIAQEAKADELREHIYGNYLDSRFDIGEEEAGRILYAVMEDERGAAWRFLVGLTDAEEPDQASLDEE